jgi:CO/xanthine dehydrogenase FAD-binding subunit
VDLNTVSDFVSHPAPDDWREGDAWLAGGTWLFSEPQPTLRRLLDLTTLNWPALVADEKGLEIAATCTIAELYEGGTPLARQCCEAFLASFKIWNEATVGGNLCNALPAGPMISLTAALDGTCLIQGARHERRVKAVDFVVGDNQHVLQPGELLRSIHLPASALAGRTAFRRQSLNTYGRSAALLIGRNHADGWTLTVTASVKHPVQLQFSPGIDQNGVREAVLGAIPEELWHDDVHGRPAWRRHLTLTFAEEIRRELAA